MWSNCNPPTQPTPVAYNNIDPATVISHLILAMIFFIIRGQVLYLGTNRSNESFSLGCGLSQFLQNYMWHTVLKALTLLWSNTVSHDSLSLKIVCLPLPPAQQQSDRRCEEVGMLRGS